MTPTTGRRRDAAAFARSLLSLLVVLVGIPVVLALLAGWPLPHALPSVTEIRRALDEGWSPDGMFVLKAVAVVAWLAWAEIATCLVVELAAALRGRRAPRVPTAAWAQPLVARLVAGLLLAQTLAATATPADARPPLAAASLATASSASAPVLAVAAQPAPSEPPAPPVSTPTPAAVRYEVHRHDTLWDIAERHLGDPLRWREIFAANRDRTQPDGRRLLNPDRIYPGWVLDLPADAAGLPAPAPTPAPAPMAQGAPAAAPPTMAAPDRPPTTTPAAARASATSPTTAPPTTTPPTTAAPRTSPPPPAARADGDAPPAEAHRRPRSARPIVDIGLPLLAAGGLIATLDRLRRAQQRRRRAGQVVPKPPVAAESTERRARAVAADDAGVWVDATLRYLAAQLPARPGPAPQVLGVRAGALGVEVLLDPPDPAPPAGFDAADGGHVWRLDPDLDLPTVNERAGVASPPIPALVTLGDTADGPVLVNLEHLGALAVDGDPDHVGPFLAGLALELAVAPWAEGVQLIVVGADAGTLIALDNVTHAPDPDILAERLEASATARDEELGERASTLAARAEAAWSEGWAPTVVLVPPEAASPDAVARLVAAAHPERSGVAVVAAAATSLARWRLHIDAVGAAALDPLGMILRCGLDAAAVAAAESLLAAAAQPPQDAEAESETLIDLTEPEPEVAAEVEVRVLGPIEVTAAAKPTNRKKIIEVLAYLATHPDHPVPTDTLRSAVWPLDDAGHDIGYATFKQAMSRARATLGDDRRGYKHLPDAHDGAYHLGPGVDCDWSRFRRLVARAHAAPSGDAINLLRQALGLVRATPFADAPAGTYTWAYSEHLVSDMERDITDAALCLAALALDAGDPATAEWAAQRGLLVVPAHEALHQARLRAAEAAGGADALQRAWRDTRAAAAAADPLDEPDDDTVALYNHLVAARATTTVTSPDGQRPHAEPAAARRDTRPAGEPPPDGAPGRAQ